MDKEKREKEPFKPENTPQPPQQMDPDVRKKKHPEGERAQAPDRQSPGGKGGHLLNEEADINDETTL